MDDQEYEISFRSQSVGLPLRLQSCHINQAIYGESEEDILAVQFHQGAVIAIDRAGVASTKASGLCYPHGLTRLDDGRYLIADTQRGAAHFMDKNFGITSSISLCGLLGIRADRSSCTEWLQFIDVINCGIYCISDTHRSQFHIVDMINCTRFSIDIPSKWSLQRVVSLPSHTLKKLCSYLSSTSGLLDIANSERSGSVFTGVLK